MLGLAATLLAMTTVLTEAEVLERLAVWGHADDAVRALVLTSSRARQDASVDLLSDYDVIVGALDAAALASTDSLQRACGEPVARWGDQSELYGMATFFRGIAYADGLKVDFSVWPAELLDRVARETELPAMLDVGYRVILDKDARTPEWRSATHRAHVPAQPTGAEFEAAVEEFWWSATYVAKSLWRGEIVFAKFALDVDAKLGALRRILEWRIELDHSWSLRPGVLGRGIERLLPQGLWAELAPTYVGTDIDENWEALFRTAAIFRQVAGEVGDALGFPYPLRKDEAITTHLHAVRALPPKEQAQAREM